MPVARFDQRCPGSGLLMTPSISVTRVTDELRRRYADHIERFETLGEPEEAASLRKALAQLEADDGHEHEVLACAVCGNRWLTPTRSGTARPHTAQSPRAVSWDEVRRLRITIAALDAELDRVLEQLAPD